MAAVRRAGFGTADLSDPEAPAALLKLGRVIARDLQKGISLGDAFSVLFDLWQEPTVAQIETLVESVVTHLAPTAMLMNRPTGFVHARPITTEEVARREGCGPSPTFSWPGTWTIGSCRPG